MNHQRLSHSAIWFGASSIFVSGGYYAPQACEMFDTLKNEWKALPNLNVGRSYHSACCFNNSAIFVFCGHGPNVTPLGSIEKYSTESNQWELIENKLSGRCLPAAI